MQFYIKKALFFILIGIFEFGSICYTIDTHPLLHYMYLYVIILLFQSGYCVCLDDPWSSLPFTDGPECVHCTNNTLYTCGTSGNVAIYQPRMLRYKIILFQERQNEI